MAKAAKKAVKGKYTFSFSRAPQPLKMKALGPWRLALYLQPHAFGEVGRQLTLPGHEAEVEILFQKWLKKKSGLLFLSLIWEREFKIW